MKTKILLFLSCTGILFFMSCSPKLSTQNHTTSDKIFYPKNTDTARIQYLKGFSSTADITKLSKFSESIVGKSEQMGMIKPYGISVRENKIYVSDIGIKGLNIIDLENKTFSQFNPGTQDLQFVLASFVDSNGDRYIMDTKFSKIAVFDEKGQFKSRFSIEESDRPVDIFIKDDKIFVAALKGQKINIYSKTTHELLDFFPKNVTQEDEAFLYQPMDIFLTDELIYVLDAGAFKVKIYTLEGEFVKSFGEFGVGYGQFNRPKSVAVDKEGNIFVVDSSLRNVQMLNKEGQMLMFFGEPRENSQGLLVPTSMMIDYNNLEYFKDYVDPRYTLKYVIYVVNQQARAKVQAFGRIELK